MRSEGARAHESAEGSSGGADRYPHPIRILHVDDDAAIRSLTRDALAPADADLEFDGASSGSEALDRFDPARHDCIVSDYDMDGMDGLELLRAVRDRYGSVPFVMFTGTGTEAVASRAISAGVTDYVRKDGGSEQFELLGTRLRNAVAEEWARRRAATLERVGDLARRVNRALIRAETAEDIADAVCAIVADADPYRFAWIGREDPADGTVRPVASAGEHRGYLDDIEVSVDAAETGRGPTGRALRSGRVVVADDIAADPDFAPWRDEALDRGFLSSAAVPLVHDGCHAGVLNVYADRPGAFDARERELLGELGEDIANATAQLATRDRIARRADDLETYETIFETAQDGIFLIDVDDGTFRIDRFNPKEEALTGLDTEAVRGRPIREVLGGDTASDVLERYRECVKRREVIEYEETLDLPGGTRRWRTRVAPIVEDDAVDKLVGIARDVTDEWRRREELEILNRVMRHDIRNDMMLILGWGRLLEPALSGTEDEEKLDRMLATGEQVVELTELARDFVEAVTSGRDADLDPIDVPDLVRREVEKAREMFGDVAFTVEGATDAAAFADEMLSSAVRNLLTNAVTHNDADDPTVTVSVRDRDGTVEVTVADNGPGIPPEVVDAVESMEPFADGGSTGIGLHLVARVVELYDGSVEIRGNEPRGAVVTLRLPAASPGRP